MRCPPTLLPGIWGGRRGQEVPTVGKEGRSRGGGLRCTCASPAYSRPFPVCRGGDAELGSWGQLCQWGWRQELGVLLWPGNLLLPSHHPSPHWRMSPSCHQALGGLSPPGTLSWQEVSALGSPWAGWTFRYLGLGLQSICPTDAPSGNTDEDETSEQTGAAIPEMRRWGAHLHLGQRWQRVLPWLLPENACGWVRAGGCRSEGLLGAQLLPGQGGKSKVPALESL